MKVLYSWIEEYAQTGIDPHELAEKLTMLGMEVESVTPVGGEIEGLVAGYVVAAEKHKDSDHLSVCRVELPGGEVQIICGAENVRAGLKVPVAQVGCVLPGDFKIKKAKIRGVESFGMICSREELGLEEKSKGIWELPESVPVGAPSVSFLGERDYVYEVSLTSNRSDCLSVLGLAREAAAAYGKRMAYPEPAPAVSADVAAPSIEIKDPELCARYSGRIVQGVKIGSSPEWLVRRLEACGMRSINNIVDITNYVLLEFGHPLHAFDLRRLEGEKIVVRRAAPGEKMVTLDDVERELTSETLVICDAVKPVALAGVMGGANSEVAPETVDLLIESAWFDPVSIRRTSRRTGLVSEASYRFARTADWGNTVKALDRCVGLILELAGGTAGQLADIYPAPKPERKAVLRAGFMQERVGLELTGAEIAGFLDRLGFTVTAQNADEAEAVIPTWRSDVNMEADLAEEVVRLYGYDRLPVRLFPVRANEEVVRAFDSTKRMAQDLLSNSGLQEVVNANFVLQEELTALLWEPEQVPAVINPMSHDQKYLRPALMLNILRNMQFNQGHGFRDMGLFETGKVFNRDGDGGFVEELHLAVGLTGKAEAPSWLHGSGREWDFYDLSGYLELLCTRFGVVYRLEQAQDPRFHPGRYAVCRSGDRVLGYLGEVHPALVKSLDLNQKIFIMELSLDLLGSMRREFQQCSAVSKFPSSLRDLAFVVDAQFPVALLLDEIRKAADFLKQVSVVSVFQGEQIGAGKKSVAFSMEFIHESRTLSDDEIDKVQQKIIDRVAKQCKGELR